MDAAEIVMVFWLVLGGTSQTGQAIHPVPFASEEQCMASARAAENEYYPTIYGQCYPQPASDVARWNDSQTTYNGRGFGDFERVGK